MERVTAAFWIFILSLMSLSTTCQASLNTLNGYMPIDQKQAGGNICWYRGSQGTIEAMGTGSPPAEETSAVKGRKLAYQAAVVDAQRELLGFIQDMRVNDEVDIGALTAADNTIKTEVADLVKTAKIIEVISQPYGSYLITLSVNMFGTNSIGKIVFDSINSVEPQNFPQVSEHYKQESSVSSLQDVNTGVIINVRKLGLAPTFSPRIYDESGRIVYSNQYLSKDVAVARGVAEYIPGSEMYRLAKSGESRAGIRPLVIKAIKLRDNNCNVVISNADADAMLVQNHKWGILKNCAVVFAI